MLFCSGRQGTASYSPDVPGTDLKPLFDTILRVHPRALRLIPTRRSRCSSSSIDYNEYVGRIAIGRIERGRHASRTRRSKSATTTTRRACAMKAKAVIALSV